MKSIRETQSERKRRGILEAATNLFLDSGYDGTTMEGVAQLVGVSKPTVYKYFKDKETLFGAIIRETTDQVDGLVRLVAETLTDSDKLEDGLTDLARLLLGTLMQPRMLRLRRLVVANAGRFPEIGTAWYDGGFERVLSTIAKCFQQFTDRKLLTLSDPLIAANHFVGLVLWIPMNRAMFRGEQYERDQSELENYARHGVRVFLDGYATLDRR